MYTVPYTHVTLKNLTARYFEWRILFRYSANRGHCGRKLHARIRLSGVVDVECPPSFVVLLHEKKKTNMLSRSSSICFYSSFSVV